jgi:hypothetical protein
MGTQCLGVKLGHPVSGGHKYGGLVLQVGGLGVGSTGPLCKVDYGPYRSVMTNMMINTFLKPKIISLASSSSNYSYKNHHNRASKPRQSTVTLFLFVGITQVLAAIIVSFYAHRTNNI